MAAVPRPQDRSAWLGESGGTPADAKALLRTYEDDGVREIAPQAPPSKAMKSLAVEGEMF